MEIFSNLSDNQILCFCFPINKPCVALIFLAFNLKIISGPSQSGASVEIIYTSLHQPTYWHIHFPIYFSYSLQMNYQVQSLTNIRFYLLIIQYDMDYEFCYVIMLAHMDQGYQLRLYHQ